jgi:hypothetical protein
MMLSIPDQFFVRTPRLAPVAVCFSHVSLMCLTQLRNASTLVAVEPVMPSPRDAQQANSIEQQSGHGGTIADPFLGPTTRVPRTIVGVRVGLMTRHRFGWFLFSMFRIDAPCAIRRYDGSQSSRGRHSRSALANTHPCHDHAGNSFKSARRWMRSRMS